MPKAPGKILIIRFSSLGDLILILPMLRALRRGLPEATINLLTKERYAGVFEGNPFIDRLVTLGRGGLRELFALRGRLAAERYDTIIDAHGVIRSELISRTLRASRKLRIRKDEAKKAFLVAGKINLYRGTTSQVERYLEIVRRLGLAAADEPGALRIPEGAAARAEALLAPAASAGRIVAFAPGAHWETKMWPKEHWAELISRVGAEGLRPVLVGGHEDAALNAELARQAGPRALDLTGALSIMESAAVLARSAALVTNDSAPMHLAEAAGTPVVAFFGPTVKEFGYFPRLEASLVLEATIGCRPCSRNGKRRCPYHTKECLARISPAAAFQALRMVLDGRAVRS